MARLDDLVLIGASGHAKVVLEIIRAAGRYRIVGCLDPSVRGDVLGVPVLGDDDVLSELYGKGVRYAFVAIGANRIRERVISRVRSLGFALPAAISPTASVSPSAVIGDATAIMGGVTINACAKIGDGAIINTNASVDHDCVIGDYAHCAPGTHLAGCVTVGPGAFLGVGVSAIPSVCIGAWSTIGAGAVVVRDVPADTIAIGVPARAQTPVRRTC